MFRILLPVIQNSNNVPYIRKGACTMKKVDLTPDENKKYKVIKSIVDGTKDPDFDIVTAKKKASVSLKLTPRHINRLIKKYRQQGKAAFSHGNRGYAPATTYPKEQVDMICDLYVEKYADQSIASFCKILPKLTGLDPSETSVRNWPFTHGIASPKALTRSQPAARLEALKRKKS